MITNFSKINLSKKDFQSDNEVRWCPGCGDYAILAGVQKSLAELNLNRDSTVFISGIGCAARFPYYMNTYGLHTIHGRAPAFASGVKLANPDLNIFLVTGDGDALSIGATHLLHLFRRNINLTVLLFNNQVYGLTKGQYSPTSTRGHVGKSTPFGSLEEPVNPIAFALAAGASFVARTIDNDAQHLSSVLKAAVAHKGTSFIEILQSCVVYNDNAFDYLRDKSMREQNIILLRENEPLLFNNGTKAIALDPQSLAPKIVDAQNISEILIHEPHRPGLKAQVLARLTRPDFPTPLGIFSALKGPTYEELKHEQEQVLTQRAKNTNLKTLLRGSNTWEV
jgi:2-oxoglutarate ferredoxin oxidoreductase subunit beta